MAETSGSTRIQQRFTRSGPSLREFLATEAGGATLLLGATILALVWANSPFSASYSELWHTDLTLGVPGFSLTLDLHTWVNDALMAAFFLVVGLEINREVTDGDLRDRRFVAVPALGALGGLALPAIIYLLINPSGEAARGWGIAMSTDTAFVIGILALFGPRCPDRLRLLLLTLAIVDDIGAISVMALFYTDSLDLAGLAGAAVVAAVLLALRWWGVRSLVPYVVGAIVLWIAVHESGVHATLAGVLIGLLVPAGPAKRRRPKATAEVDPRPAPAVRLQRRLHPLSAYVIVPVFGLANAGVSLSPEVLREAVTSPVTIGVAVALVLGNAVGVFAMSSLAIRAGWGLLPGRVRYSHLFGGAILAGIGFTISLFIAELAFTDHPVLLDQAKLGVLAGSLTAAVLGTLVLRFFGERSPLCSPGADELPATLPPRPWVAPG